MTFDRDDEPHKINDDDDDDAFSLLISGDCIQRLNKNCNGQITMLFLSETTTTTTSLRASL